MFCHGSITCLFRYREVSLSVCRCEWERVRTSRAVFHVAASRTSLRMLNKQVIGGKCWCFQLTALLLHAHPVAQAEFPLIHDRLNGRRREEAEKKIQSKKLPQQSILLFEASFVHLYCNSNIIILRF